MREGIRDTLLFLGVAFAGIQVWQARSSPQPQAHIASLYIVAVLFVLAGGLNVAPFLLRNVLRRSQPTRLAKDDTAETKASAVPVEDQIYIHVEALAVSVIGDQAKAGFVVFSAKEIELTFCRLYIGTSASQPAFSLESAEPTHIPAFNSLESAWSIH